MNRKLTLSYAQLPRKARIDTHMSLTELTKGSDSNNEPRTCMKSCSRCQESPSAPKLVIAFNEKLLARILVDEFVQSRNRVLPLINEFQ